MEIIIESEGGFYIICRKVKVEDEEQWNNVVKESLNGTFYHTWEWKEVIEKGLNSEALSVVVKDEEENKLIGIFPFFIRNLFEDYRINKYFPSISKNFQIGCSPHHKLYSFGGPCVLSSDTNSEEIYELMFDFIDSYSKNKKSFTDHLIYPYHNCLDSALIQNGYTKTGIKKTAIVNIDKDPTEIFKGFKKQFSRDIKKASRKKIIIYESQNYEEDIDLYYNQFQKLLIDRIIERTKNCYRRVSYALVPYSYFEKLRDILFPKKMARLFFAEYNGVKVGALINFYYKDTIYLGHISVLRGEYNSLNANKLLIWHSIVDGRKNGFKNLDVAGLHPNESHGQYRFKMGFNGQVKEIGVYNKSYRYNGIKHAKAIVNELRKQLLMN
ncbi:MULTISPECIES: GNAT family N-acetyltransferase [unclassified Methanosarcina]|uniref:lipid II:glycine glycyltransferase FemX n=1 Tax=unclassified Methanosarcina TaxID=2644672 RepID=UPI000615D348|nr:MULTISPECIES: GNAT family N-acetyltransferase [unclassified Methanosarcina]AKB17722.1 FemAB-related protein, PEP-CTERM system-associated [Methanosarcina sp. WWM596]AKB21078.1 FemAB-related protein, PEP-CTERM system-associated [Methanosarcina sp. WH1]